MFCSTYSVTNCSDCAERLFGGQTILKGSIKDSGWITLGMVEEGLPTTEEDDN